MINKIKRICKISFRMVVNEYLNKKLRVLNMLIASAKSRSVRGTSHQWAFMSSRLTISHTFYLPYLPRTCGVLIDVPWSLMIGPIVAQLAHFLCLVWFQV